MSFKVPRVLHSKYKLLRFPKMMIDWPNDIITVIDSCTCPRLLRFRTGFCTFGMKQGISHIVSSIREDLLCFLMHKASE